MASRGELKIGYLTIEFLGKHTRENNLVLNEKKINDNQIDTIITYLKYNPHITRLHLNFNNISDQGAFKLAAYDGLISIKLRGNQIRSCGAIALANQPALQSLDLTGNNINSRGVRYLLTKNSTLRRLDLRGNEFDDSALIGIEENTSLLNLGLRGNHLTDKSAILIARNTGLRLVDLSYNCITDKGTKALAEINSTIHILNLRGNNISDQSAMPIALNESFKRIDLSFNKITDKSALILATNANYNDVTLIIHPSEITDKGKSALATNNPIERANFIRKEKEIAIDDTKVYKIPTLQHLATFFINNHKRKLNNIKDGSSDEHLKKLARYN